MPHAASSIAAPLLVFACAVVFAARTFGLFFVADDFASLPANRPLQWPSAIDFFSDRFLARTLSFFVLDALIGLRPALYHVIVVLLHTANAWRLYLVLTRTLRFHTGHALTAALLFVLHPVAYTPLAWIGLGFEECWSALLALAAVQIVLPQTRDGGVLRGLIAGSLAVLAGGFKNYCLLFPFVITAFALVDMHQGGYPRRPYLTRLAAALVPMTAFAVWYVTLMCSELRRNAYYAIPLPGAVDSAGKSYTIRIAGREGNLGVPMLPASFAAPAGFAPLDYRRTGQAAPTHQPAVLAYRAVLTP